MTSVLQEIIPYLPSSAEGVLLRLSKNEADCLREIRIRAAGPMLLNFGFERRICSEIIHTKEDIDATFRKICASSAYTHRHEIRCGYVTIPGGHRVGIVGTAVMGEGGRLEGMRDIVGLSFRVARDCSVPVENLTERMFSEHRIRNLLIVGPPCSGKTTFLRALARRLSQRVQVSVIDEREELFPSLRPVPVGCDVLRGYPKAEGILQALRTLSPAVVVCDEIGTEEEVGAMADGLRSGVALLVSAHTYLPEELMYRPPIRRLIDVGGIDFVAVLDGKQPGTVAKILERKELYAEISDAPLGVSSVRGDRSVVRP